MCSVLDIHFSGYYDWLKEPQSPRAKIDEYYLGFIKQFWLESGCVYGYRKIYEDMLSIGEMCGRNRVLRLMQQAQIRAERGYKKKPTHQGGEASMVAPNLLNRQFDVQAPNRVWVSDCSGSINPDTHLGGNLATVNEVFNGKEASIIYSRVQKRSSRLGGSPRIFGQ